MRKLLVVLAFAILPLASARAQSCPGVAPWVFVDVAASHAFCTYVTWMAQTGVTTGCRFIDANTREYCPDDFVTRLQMAAFMNRLGNALFPLTCAAGQVMKWNGAAWTCANDNIGGSGGGGTVTSVLAGTGLAASPNPIVGAGSINLAPSYQLPQSCANGQVPKSNGTGGWTCGNDNAGTGTVTSVATGAGLTGGAITAAGTIAIAAGGVTAAMLASNGCANGQVLKWNGSAWACAADAAGPANAFVQGGNTFGAEAVLGTTSDHALEVRVNGARVMRYEPNAVSPNVIGGSPANNVTAGVRGATIAGGGVPAGSTDPVFSNEAPNRVTDHYGTVGGGYANRAGDDAGTTFDRAFATVGGGYRNIASGDVSTVAGGEGSTASGMWSVVGGGVGNNATGNTSTVGGGTGNSATGTGSTVGGGGSQACGPSCILTGQNIASGDASTVPGGLANTASGLYSTVAGGAFNTASGNSSWAGGNRAKTQTADAIPVPHHGAFVWADSSDFDFRSTANNEFAARATGGVRFVTAIDGGGSVSRQLRVNPGAEIEFGNNVRQMLNLWGSAYGIGVQTDTQYFRTNNHFGWYHGGTHSDAMLDAGGGSALMTLTNGASSSTVTGTLRAQVITQTSDRTQKRDFAAIDAQDVLARVVELPIETWAYRNEPAVRHMGPSGQAFQAAFGLGHDEKSIATVDADGVALAAIQGLNAKLEARVAEQEAALASRDAEISQLKTGLVELRRAVELLNARVGGDERVAKR